MKKFLKKHWWKVLIGVLVSILVGVGIFAFVKAKPVMDFVGNNFASESSSDLDVTKDPFIVYISAADDAEADINEAARSDLNILAVVNPAKAEILLVNVPRDAYVKLAGVGEMDKLTHAGYQGGVEMSKATIEELLGIEINYTLKVNFNALAGVVDAIDGIAVTSDIGKSFSCYHDKSCVIHDGENELDGKCAVAFARERLAYGEGDLERAENEEQVIDAIFSKIAKNKKYLLNYEEILAALDGSFTTTLTGSDAWKLVQKQIQENPNWKVTKANIGVTGSGQEYTYTFPDEKKFVFYLDENSVAEVVAKIRGIMGE